MEWRTPGSWIHAVHNKFAKGGMVLAHKITCCALLSLVVTGSNLSQSQMKRAEPRKVDVASYKLRVEERGGKCVLDYDGPAKGKLMLDLLPPCDFVRDRTKAAQSFRYRNGKSNRGGHFVVVMVLGGPLDNVRSDEFFKQGCGTRAQAVSLSSRGVAAGALGSGIVVCPSEGMDKKMYGFLAKPK